jgi:hypothetical protein
MPTGAQPLKFARFKFWDGKRWVKSYSVESKEEADKLNKTIGRIFYVPIDAAQ